MEIFKKGVKEWEKGGCSKKGGLEDGEGAGGGRGQAVDFCLSFSSLPNKIILILHN